MSHFSTVKTELRDLSALRAALQDMGHTPEEGTTQVRGYRGQTVEAQLALRQDNGCDIGFRWNGNHYELVTDLQLWNQQQPLERFLSRLNQRYALHTILSATQQEGFQVSEQKSSLDGTIELVVTRWSH
ncbi:MAG: DUF1257 domain-containing protein [Aphanocapsa feldmannii 277cV]|uniref:DUF1257 domain-containing protein n=2 Tax=Aphanocapsa feldmannii TaxID=192050 RepID=A0A524RPC1_9CHRO|nr:MAG: DUF1257 domain-containing protein [Aphanocapsa feldmannii 288cV]TGG93638.1 MAG: DUF1257 domain-containing protein [Aphanocapsa feldmannii 277cV]TGH19898.1 MAG: DUF1257 domain-containing protein [Aphanocapsa feldmannii 277cI]